MPSTYTDILQKQQQQPPTGQPTYDKIGGWLILVGIAFIVGPLRIILLVFKDILPAFAPQTWSVLTTPGTEAYHPLWAPILIGELVGNLFFVCLGIVLIVLFFQKRKIFPKLAIFYLLANLVFVVGDTLVAGLIPFVAQQDNSSSMKEIFRSVVGAGVWVPYFLTSKRVKGTFVR
ncbi:MAG: hypothetical protein RBG1_1C00001G1183 [candidate division Zixibacteria bacterium RBG-1]|nr:MAG: hypothetical protein RBG1_1C00001G1183 [candidate division Zixibacteria bacterium RBG-1]